MFIDRIRLSKSKTLASFLAVFCFGILLGGFVPAFETASGVLTVILPFGVGLLLPSKRSRFMVLLIAVLMLGVFRYHQALLPSNVPTVADRVGVPVRVEGVVDAEVERREQNQRVLLDNVKITDWFVEGKILVWLQLYPEVVYGQTLTFNCTLEKAEPVDGFAYDRYLATQGVYAVCGYPQFVDVGDNKEFSLVGAVLGIKTFLLDRLEILIPAPHSHFLSGLLFGGSSSISPELKDNFSRTGLSHILAASGFNVSLFSLIFLTWILQTPIGRKRGLILTGFLLLVYTITAGATPAVVRAAIMGLLVLVEHWISRKAFMLNVILLAMTLMLLVNPLLLLDDVGFQLSFVATTALLLCTKPIAHYLSFIPNRFGLRESFSASLAAIFATLPIIIWHFGQVSLIAPLANLLVLPLVPFAIAFGIVAVAVSLVSAPLGMVAALPAWALSLIMLWLISVLGSVDVFVFSVEATSIVAIASLIFPALLIVIHRTYVHP